MVLYKSFNTFCFVLSMHTNRQPFGLRCGGGGEIEGQRPTPGLYVLYKDGAS
jgi:hypothetical protein